MLSNWSEGGAAVATRIPSKTEPPEFLLEALREGAEFTLYRGRQRDDPAPVLVVAPAAEQPRPQSRRRLEHEYSLAAELEPAWAARPIALKRQEGRTILVIADPGGDPLDRILNRDREQPFDLARLLRVAIGMATALGHLHRRGVIHKDIKPENVLADDAGNVWLTGFGIASRLPRERQVPDPPESIAGTLAYMAPEQTGRMNRSIDSRSDLYSLGVTFYEMLTGELPFPTSDTMECIHSHVARQPAAPSDRRKEIPVAISTIVVKLLAKNAEDRYQTAGGVACDLRKCLAEWELNGSIEPFPLGARDAPDRLLIPERLYGREREVETLLGAFDRVVQGGPPELVLVSGYSGIGKSSVVNELHRVLVPPRGLFASGKFDQYKRDIPYSTVVQAFRGLVRTLLGKSDGDLAIWSRAFLEALEPNARLMTDLIPELKLIIDEPPPVPALEPRQAQSRFQLAFRRFIDVFARPEHPLALFFDDLQWIDAATLDLLEDLLTRSDLRHLTIIGAYRDNEVDAAHPLARKLDAIRQGGARIEEIHLAPLARHDLEQLIADALRCNPAYVAPLAQRVHEKTAGNPFFVIQFLYALAEERLLRFDLGLDDQATRWSWDLDRIHDKGYTENVVDLMAGKVTRLPLETQQALQEVACLGNVAATGMLSIVFTAPEEQVHAVLWPAVLQELVERREGSYKFIHDRVQEAAYSLIPEASRAGLHLRIGRLLAARMAPEKRESVFEIVNQLNRGAALITEQEERDQLAELNLIAGKHAEASTAYASALKYFMAGALLFTEECWERRRDLIFQLELHRGQCEILTGQLESAAARLEMLRSRASNTVELATATCSSMDAYLALFPIDRGIGICLDYLRHVGIDWPLHPTGEQAQSEYQRTWSQLENREIGELMDLPLMSDSNSIATLDVLTKLLFPALYTDANLAALVICGMATLSIERGNHDGSCLGYVFLGMVAATRFGDYKNAWRFGQLGYEMVEKRGLKRFQAPTYYCFASILMPWMKHLPAGRDVARQAFEITNKMGDVTRRLYAAMCLNTLRIATGDPLVEVQSDAESGLKFAQKAKFGLVIDSISSQLGLVRTLRGLTTEFGSFDRADFSEVEFERHLDSLSPTVRATCNYWIRKLQARFFAGDLASALAASSKAHPQLLSSSVFELAEFEFYSALAQAACCDSVTPDQTREHFDAIGAHYAKLRMWAEHCPENFENRAALVGAEIARLEGRDLDAESLYEQAIRSARANGFVHNEALAHEVAAQFYAARGLETFAHAYLRIARNGYDLWGASAKVSQLEERYPHLRTQSAASLRTATIDAPVTQFDAETVLKASQTLSSEIDLPRLIERLMRLAVEHAGAERGLLILVDDSGQRIEAEARAGPGSVEISARHERVTPIDLPQSVLQYVVRTHKRVLLDDAAAQSESEDEYLRNNRPRSVLCLPILKQTKVVGALYLENNLTAHAFTPGRVAVLEVLASQAAISLENARLYSDLHRSEAFLAQGQQISQTGSFGWSVAGGELYWSEETYNIVECDRASKPTIDLIFQFVHPGDQDFVRQTLDDATREKTDFDIEHRLLMPDGRVKHVHIIGRAMKTGNLDFVGAVTDITAAKKAEEKIRQSEKEARQLLDMSPLHITELGPDGARLYTNRASLDYYGIALEEWQDADLQRVQHPQDAEIVPKDLPGKLQSGLPFEYEARLKRKDGQYRWFHYRLSPMSDEQGRITRWYAAGTDIDDRKLAEQKLQEENVALREEVDKASMFEEIVGISASLKKVLSRISKVAPTDSSVLITGETGTGKELAARAIHRRSPRSSHTFVSVNCAVIPRDLIASELFGHEKGAFTGATQRRLGRFELAEKGTIFLDEVGELPAETQIALLRVLQEREFERIGGTGSIRTDVRVIAATNRDLEAAIAAGTFRSDLYYRLNVFPIEMPTLRQRSEDIPLLVTYFLNRYARKAGKHFTAVDKQSLDLLQSYAWPGNIRELQNVIERSVVVSESQIFSVDESWLSRRPSSSNVAVQPGPFTRLPAEEKAVIEAALLACGGRVYGPSGAAARLGMPRTTLESKIKSLKINKNRFRGPLKDN